MQHTPTYLEPALFGASKRGRVQVVQKIINCRRFNDIHRIVLSQSFVEACGKGNSQVVQRIMDSNRFIDIHPGYLESALISACSLNNDQIIRLILNSSRNENITPFCLAYLRGKAIITESKESYREIIHSQAYKNMSYKDSLSAMAQVSYMGLSLMSDSSLDAISRTKGWISRNVPMPVQISGLAIAGYLFLESLNILF